MKNKSRNIKLIAAALVVIIAAAVLGVVSMNNAPYNEMKKNAEKTKKV